MSLITLRALFGLTVVETVYAMEERLIQSQIYSESYNFMVGIGVSRDSDSLPQPSLLFLLSAWGVASDDPHQLIIACFCSLESEMG